MDSIPEEKPKLKRTWPRVVLVVVSVLAITGMLGYYFWPHFLWKYAERRFSSSFANMKKVPLSPMPEIDVPDDWAEHAVGRVGFRLPPEMPDYLYEGQVAHPDIADFCNENNHVKIMLGTFDSQGLLDEISRIHPEQKTFSSMTQLRIESCDILPADFRWSMSPKEAKWHTFIVSLRPVLVLPTVEHAEFLADKNLEGLLYFSDDPYRLRFEWECVSCPLGGTIYFSDMNEQDIDADFVRMVIHSIDLDCGCSP